MLNKYLEQVKNEEVKLWINTVLKNYLKKNPENQGEIEHILDYLQSEDAPTRLKKMSYIQAKSNTEKWMNKLKKKGNNIVELDEDVKPLIKWKDGMRLVQLVGENAFKREGFLMSHCVASYTNKQGVKVYSLRDKNNNPHCTIEVVGDKNVNQIKGKGNGPIHPKYIKYIIKVLKKTFNMEVKENEMRNLGYYVAPEGFLDFMKEKLVVKTLKHDKKTYIYVK